MPTSAIQSRLKQHEEWLVGLRQDSCMTLAKIQTELHNQKGLTASSSQLEIFFRNSGQRKNLSRPEWITVFCALDSQKAFGRMFDLYLSGKPITDQGLQNKRKNAKPARPLASCLDEADKLLAQLPDGVTLQLRLPRDSPGVSKIHRTIPMALPEKSVATLDGELNMRLVTMPTINDSVSATSAVVPEIASISESFCPRPKSNAITGQTRLVVSQSNTETCLAPVLELPDGLDSFALSAAFGSNYAHGTEDLEMEYGDPYSFHDLTFYDNWPQPFSPVTFGRTLETPGMSSICWGAKKDPSKAKHLLMFLYGQSVSANQTGFLSAELDHMSWESITGGHQTLELSLIEPARLLVEDAGSATCRRARSPRDRLLPTAEELLDSLQSLVSIEVAEGEFFEPLDSVDAPEFSKNGFVHLFVFSVINNFAGTHQLPKGRIMQFINQHKLVRSSISSHLETKTSTFFSTALAEKLLEPAIEACDAETVHYLLALKIFKPDDIVCTVHRRSRTPIEKAASLHHFEIVSLLLQFGADVNKTYEDEKSYSERGALECAIGLWGEYRPIDLKAVDLLLENGATVSSRLAGAAVRWGDIGPIERLISKLCPSKHECLFADILTDVAKYLANDIGYEIIRKIFWACRDDHANKCFDSNQELLAEMMVKAVRRKNEKLVELLLPHGGQKGLDSALTVAVSSGSHSLVQKLISHGACADGPAEDGTRLADSEYEIQPGVYSTYPRQRFLTTPLAEAIRGNDAELVDLLVKEGAWNKIGEPGRLEAALRAIAESGNSAYLFKVLQSVPDPKPEALSEPLAAAINYRHDGIALTLLEAGANVNSPGDEPPLLVALRMKNQSITWAILEHDAVVNYRRHPFSPPMSCSALEEAARWGDLHIIRALLFMGADINTFQHENPLTIAVKSQNRSLVELLINLGADLTTKPERTPLPVFARNEFGFLPDLSSTPLTASALVGDVETADYLLQHGAVPADEEAILEAAIHDRRILILILHKFRKQHPKGRTGFGSKAMQYGLETHDEALLDLCLSAGFDVNSMSCRQDYNVVSTLGMAILKHRGGRLDLISKLLSAGGDANMLASEKWGDGGWIKQTAFLDAIETKSLALVELLISRGADVRKEAKLGLKRTPLQKACEVASYAVVSLILQHNVEVNAAPAARGGATALQLAAKAGSTRIAKKLLELGADVNAPGVRLGGRSAIEYAAEYGRLNMIPVLCNAAGWHFSAGQYENAIALAQNNGHPACAGLLRNLASGSQGFVEAGSVADGGGRPNVLN